MGGFISENVSWRWIFWVVSIADVFVQLSGLFFLQETYAPRLLLIKKNKLIKETGNTKLHAQYEDLNHNFWEKLATSLVRPFRLIATQIIIQVLALYMMYLYGLMYLVLSTFPTLWTGPYHENVGISGLNYISLGLGFFLGAQIGSRVNDRIYKALRARNDGVGKPEFRVPIMLPGAVLVPTGLFIYGWTAQYHTHWIFPNIGTCIFAAGVIIGFQSLQTYIVDSYTRYAASAVGATTFLRSLGGFGFPLFAPYM
jgi:MFS family permease